MTEATVTETTEYVVRYPDGTTKELTFYNNGSAEYARTANGGSVEVKRAGGKLTARSIEKLDQALSRIHAEALKQIRAAEADAFDYPMIVERRVLTVTDPWSRPTL